MATDLRTVGQTGGVRPAGHGGLKGQVAPVKARKDSFTLVTGSLTKYKGVASLGTARYLAGSANPVEAIYAQVDAPGGTSLNRRNEMIKKINSLIEG